MSYNKEVLENLKKIKADIAACEDPEEAIALQAELLEMLKATLLDSKFKEGLIKRNLNDEL